MIKRDPLRNIVSNDKDWSGLTAALDLGTNKVACLIAKLDTSRETKGVKNSRIIGFGHRMSEGLRSGAIIDIERAEMIVRSTVEAAEKEAGTNIENVIVNLGSPNIASKLIAFDVSISGNRVSDQDLRRAFHPNTLSGNHVEGEELVHSIPIGYSIDGNRGIRDPRGMFGEQLGVNMHAISTRKGFVRNLESVISRCHLGIEKIVVSPFASALACLVEDEKEVGVTCIDMGAGTTSVAIFFDGELVFTDSIPLGSQNITNDIARGIATSLSHAERMKNCFGNAIPSISDDHEVIKVPMIGEENSGEDSQISRSMLISIIRPRLEEIFEILRDRIHHAGFSSVAGRNAVICGGGSQLPGLQELIGHLLNKQVRLGRPKDMNGLPEFAKGPEFSTCVGLLNYSSENKNEISNEFYQLESHGKSKFDRFSRWLKENL